MVKVEVTVVDAEKKKHDVFTTLGGVKVEWGLQGFSNVRSIRDKINKNFEYVRSRKQKQQLKHFVRKLAFRKRTIHVKRYPQNPPPVNLCIPFFHQPSDCLANITVGVPVEQGRPIVRDVVKGRDPPVVPGWLIELNPQVYKDIAHIRWCLQFIEYGQNIYASVKMLHTIINARLGIHIPEYDICKILRMIPRGKKKGLSFPHFMFAMANPTVAKEKAIFRKGFKVGECDLWKVPRKSSVEECRERRKVEKDQRRKESQKTEEIPQAAVAEKQSEDGTDREDKPNKSPPAPKIPDGPKPRLKFRPRPGKPIKFRRQCTPWDSEDSDTLSDLEVHMEKTEDARVEGEVETKSKTSIKSDTHADKGGKHDRKLKTSIESDTHADRLSKYDQILNIALKKEAELDKGGKYDEKSNISIKVDVDDAEREEQSKMSIKSDADARPIRPKPKIRQEMITEPENKEESSTKLGDQPEPAPVPGEDKPKSKKSKDKSFWSRMTSGWRKSEEEIEVEEAPPEVEEKPQKKHGRHRRSITTTIRMRLKNAEPSLTVSKKKLGQGNSGASARNLKRRSTLNATDPKTQKTGNAEDKNKKEKKKHQRVGLSFDEAFDHYGHTTPERPTYGRRMDDIGQSARLKALSEDEEWKLEVRKARDPEKYKTPISVTTENMDSSKDGHGYGYSHFTYGQGFQYDDNESLSSQRQGSMTSRADSLMPRPSIGANRTFHEAKFGEKFTTIHGEIIVKDARAIIHGLPADQFWDLTPRDRERQVKSFKKAEKHRLEAEKAAETRKSEAEEAVKQGKPRPSQARPALVKPDMTIPPFEPVLKDELMAEQEHHRALKIAQLQPWSSLVAAVQGISGGEGTKGLGYENAKTITKQAEIIISESHRNFMAVWGSMPMDCKDEFFSKFLKEKKKEMAKYLKDKEEDARRRAEEEKERKRNKGIFAMFRRKNKTQDLGQQSMDDDAAGAAAAEAEERKKRHRRHRRHRSKQHHETGDGVEGGEKDSSDDSSKNESEREVHAYQLMTPSLHHQKFIREYLQRRKEYKKKRAEIKKKDEERRRRLIEIERKRRNEMRIQRDKDNERSASLNPKAEKYRRMIRAREAAERAQAAAKEKARKEKKEKRRKAQLAEIQWGEPLPEKDKVVKEPVLKRRKVPLGGYLEDRSGYTFREKLFYTGLLMTQMFDSMKKFDKAYRQSDIPEPSLAKCVRLQMQNDDAGVRKKGFAEWDNTPPSKPKIDPYRQGQPFVTHRYRTRVPNLRQIGRVRSHTQIIRNHTIIQPDFLPPPGPRDPEDEEDEEEEPEEEVERSPDDIPTFIKITENRHRIRECLKMLGENEDDCVCKLPDFEYIIHMSDPAIDYMFDNVEKPTVRTKLPDYMHSDVMHWIRFASRLLYQPFGISRRTLHMIHLVSITQGRRLRKLVEDLRKTDWERAKKLREDYRSAFWGHLKVNRIPEGKLRDSFIYAFVGLFPSKLTLSSNTQIPDIYFR